MHRIEQLREFLDGSEDRYEVDPNGERLDLELGHVESRAVLVVAATTDALKEVSGGRVKNSIDRDRVWEVVGVSVDRDTITRLLEEGYASDLLDSIAKVGVEWDVIDRSVAP